MPKNIVLLSDGTGNRAAKAQGTNVWALYEALDRTPTAGRPQLAFYDDGVGTQNFLPLKLLGGAFGFGLFRNIEQLYSALVRNYELGDDIYLFGFSRGAYTVRGLAGLIARYGVLDRARYPEELALRRAIHATCRSYQRGNRIVRRSPAGGAYDPFAQDQRLRLKGDDFLHDPRPGSGLRTGVRVKFLGAWDTVDAVGLPVDELAVPLNGLFHWRFPDRRLHANVECARQALALDDERRTFWPNLWEEQPADVEGERPRIRQVWFAGVHSNVGGGYDKDQLAYVTLDWMLSEAAGLAVRPTALAAFQAEADALGHLYDSRAGLHAYYRYAPRNVERLAAGSLKAVYVHESVIERVRRAPQAYAPIWLPPSFSVVTTTSRTPRVAAPPTGLAPSRPAVVKARRLARVRRVLYFVLLAASWGCLWSAVELGRSALEGHADLGAVAAGSGGAVRVGLASLLCVFLVAKWWLGGAYRVAAREAVRDL